MGIFGFSTETKTSDFLPVLRYDARAGRFFRMDRVDLGNGFQNVPVEIPHDQFKAIFDFDNLEVGWINFQPGSPPSFVMVPMGSMRPARPTDQHKDGVRFLIKLAKPIAGPEDKAIREVAGTAKAFLSGIEAIYVEYLKFRGENPGKLPVLTLERTVPVKTGSGTASSTNYSPVFRIERWVARGDLKAQPRAVTNGSGISPQAVAAPSTGSTPRSAPAPVTNIADEF